MTFLELLNQYETYIIIILAVLNTITVIIYTYLTLRMLSENKKIREVYTEPKVVVYVQLNEENKRIIDMIIQNIGLGPTFNIKFNSDPDLKYVSKVENDYETIIGSSISEYGPIKNGIRYLGPNQKISIFLTNFIHLKKDEGRIFEIGVIYENRIGKQYKDSFVIEFSQFFYPMIFRKSDTTKIAENVEKIKDELSKGINVITHTVEDIKEEEKRFIEESLKMSKCQKCGNSNEGKYCNNCGNKF